MIQAPYAYAVASATVTNAVKAITHADFAFASDNATYNALTDDELLALADKMTIVSGSAAVRLATGLATDPTTTKGERIPANGVAVVSGNQDIRLTRFIREGGSDATVSVTLYKY